jgi:hypothetical protein
MSLKTLMAAAPNAVHDFGNTALIATTTVTAASTIATGTTGIAGVARSGMIAAVPVGLRVEVAGGIAEITAAVRSRTIGGPPPVSLTPLRLLDQQQANQRRSAKCDPKDCHRARHGVPCSRLTAEPATNCALQMGPPSGHIRRQIWRTRSLIIQAKCETFARTKRYIRCP